MNELALFAGAGGGILGGKLLGWRTVCAVEFAAEPRAQLLARQRDGILERFAIWDDVRTFDGKPWRGRVDVISGGFPCQDIGIGGKGAGIEGERSGLWREMARIICEVRPRYVLVENSPALAFRGLGRVLGDLAKMGYDAKWGVLGDADAGGHTERERIWIVAHAAGERRPKILRPHGGRGQEKTTERKANNASPRSRIDRIHALEKVAGEPAILGSNDGLADWVDRLKAIGNGQIPAVVKLAWETLKP